MIRSLRRPEGGAAGGNPSGKRCRRVIEDGDMIIVYETHDHMKPLRVESGKILNNRFGSFPHSDWIGRPFGCRVTAAKRSSSAALGFVLLLAPTPELWTRVLPHRTQILYMPDIAVVVSRLGLAPGALALESGTGSASLSHSLARAVAPHGRLHTFEFHEPRAQAARDDFARNGLSELVAVEVRDIQGLGFPVAHHGRADAVFLDLPRPWLGVPSAAACLKPNAMFCSFSPCIEQVQRCAETLRLHNFTDLQTLEVLLRTYDTQVKHSPGQGDEAGDQQNGERDEAQCTHSNVWVRPAMEARGHTGYLLFARQFV